ncbi:MAG: hypothetical protein NZ519_07680 [Bacteroidia bacterium]|nr:hypothetical protein [Bacteroidia bacterium]
MAAPSFCDTKILATDIVIVGFLNCEVSPTSTPPLPEAPTLALSHLQALVAANKLSFKRVQNFNKQAEEWQEVSFDPFIPAAITGANQTITFEDNYFDFVAETDRLYWDDKTMLANNGKLHLVTIYRGDLVTFYRTPVNLKQTLTYDATGKNIARRQFTASFMWADDKVRGWNFYVIAGAYNAFINN